MTGIHAIAEKAIGELVSLWPFLLLDDLAESEISQIGMIGIL